MSEQSAVAAPVLELLAIFTSQLRDVRFGDVDAEILRGSVDGVTTAAAAVAQAEAALAEARARLSTAQDELTRTGARALAYARIYAGSRPELAAELDRLAVPGTGSREVDPSEPSKRRGRPRKAASAQEDDGIIALPLGAEPAASPSAPS